MNEFREEMHSYPYHLFVANWQYDQFITLKENLPSNNFLLQVVDFAENYRHAYQDEPTQAHWAYNQTTIHPNVCFYVRDEKKVQEDVIVISDDYIYIIR